MIHPEVLSELLTQERDRDRVALRVRIPSFERHDEGLDDARVEPVVLGCQAHALVRLVIAEHALVECFEQGVFHELEVLTHVSAHGMPSEHERSLEHRFGLRAGASAVLGHRVDDRLAQRPVLVAEDLA